MGRLPDNDYVVVQNKWMSIQGSLYSCSKWIMTLIVTDSTQEEYGQFFMHKRYMDKWWLMSFPIISETMETAGHDHWSNDVPALWDNDA
jgi:hypothetical protein